MTTIRNFIEAIKNPHALTYNSVLMYDNMVEQAVADFTEMLEDIPDPTFRWLDERGDDCINGPGAWSCEIINDQETRFTFVTLHLGHELLVMLVEGLIEPVAERMIYNLDSAQDFQLGYKLFMEYCKNSTVQVNKLTIAVFWELSE